MLRYKKSIVLFLMIVLVFCVATTALADDWKVDGVPDSAGEEGVELDDKGLDAVTELLVAIVRWIFGIAALFLGVAVLITGIQIAISSTNVNDRAALGSRLGKLVLGAGVCFGAWFIVGVIRGMFIG